MNKTFIIYHANCPDGLTSASVFYNSLSEDQLENTVLVPGEYQKNFENYHFDFEESVVYFLDFSFKKVEMEKLLKVASKVIILDHHKTAYEDLKETCETFSNINFIYDINECGSSIVFKYLYPNKELPMTIKHIRDRDIWTWSENNSEEFCYYIDTLGSSLSSFIEFFKEHLYVYEEDKEKYDYFIQIGSMFKKDREATASLYFKNISLIDFVYKDVVVLNIPSELVSIASKVLLDSGMYNAMIAYMDIPEGRKFSCRARQEYSALKMAKAISIKSGGHLQASGAFVPKSDILEHPLTKIIYNT